MYCCDCDKIFQLPAGMKHHLPDHVTRVVTMGYLVNTAQHDQQLPKQLCLAAILVTDLDSVKLSQRPNSNLK